MAPGGVIAHWRSRRALEPIRPESPSNGAADELVTIASTFWDFASLSFKTLRRPLVPAVVAAAIRDCLDVARYSSVRELRTLERVFRSSQSVAHGTPTGTLIRSSLSFEKESD